MRPIKFRVYIKKTQEMLPVVSIVQMNDEEGLRVFPQGYDRNFLESEGDIALMQYTGLKDKNGKEIYEGDIQKTTINNSYWIYIVKSIGGTFGNQLFSVCIEHNAGSDNDYDGNYICKGECLSRNYVNHGKYTEVIGNIFENPELYKIGFLTSSE